MYHYSLKAFAQVGKKEASLSFLSCQTCHWKCNVFSNAEWPPKYMVMCLQIALQDMSLKSSKYCLMWYMNNMTKRERDGRGIADILRVQKSKQDCVLSLWPLPVKK